MRTIDDKQASHITSKLDSYRDGLNLYPVIPYENHLKLDIHDRNGGITPTRIEDIGKDFYYIVINRFVWEPPLYRYKFMEIYKNNKDVIIDSVEEYIGNYIKPRAEHYIKENTMRGIKIENIRENLYQILKDSTLPQLKDTLVEAKPEYTKEISKAISFFSKKKNFMNKLETIVKV